MAREARILVWCEKCGYESGFGLTALAGGGWDARNLDKHMKREGWDPKRDWCPECFDLERETAEDAAARP